MRHQKAGRKFGRNTSHRKAMFRNLAANLVMHERIVTTDAKAKELRRIADRLVSRAVRLGDDLVADVGKLSDDDRQRVLAQRVNAQRQTARFLPRMAARELSNGDIEEIDLVGKLFLEIAPRYLERAKAGKGGGYTRLIKKMHRRGDNAPQTIIEFLSADESRIGSKEPKQEATEPAATE